ncbi:sigma-70 family RNA polymerase sigma factor [Micromonospora cathayae]|uniref:Sigma-70 family RNA polymerase sigma factor n=1 Tax=Micromonospora cathayae TaxID=3028804 RepID=A0ABY7ZNW2_9ACTN|nr:sigma-70 family RNA polymerase sigma factor [Micromonospora sp. HUAS 3]WDZ84116.1 sigma-70 family RNA polymerase sigma factor [Micromonospora sp. HUAS 3]
MAVTRPYGESGAVTDSGVGVLATRALVSDAQTGDRAAVGELVSACLPLVYNVVGRALGGHPDTDDVVQECLLRVVRGLPGLRDPDRFRSWVLSITYRQLQEHWRQRRSATVHWQEQTDDLPDPAGDFAEQTVTELVLGGQRRDLASAARWLDADDRNLLGLWWHEATGQLTRAEVAAALGVNERHTAVRLHRMRTQLDTARAVVAALRHRPRCPELTVVVRSWDGTVSPLWRKRLARHVRDCAVCVAHRQGLVPPERLLLGLAVLPLPAALVAGLRAAVEAELAAPAVLTAGQGAVAGLPKVTHLPTGLSPPKAAVTATLVVALAVGGLVFAVRESPLGPGGEVVAAPSVPAPAGGAAATPTAPASPGGPTASVTPTPRPPAAGTGVTSADIVVAPDGDDAGDGSLARPFATLNRAVEVVRPGQTIALRGGTHRLTRPVEITTSGTADRRIVLSGYRDERAVLDATSVPADKWGVTQRTRFWTVQDLEMRGSRSHAWVCRSCTDTVFQRLSMHDNVRSGLLLRDPGTVRNQVLDSDFFRNHDPAANGSVGIGLGVKFGDGDGNVVRGNRAFHNADDGFDFGEFDGAIAVDRNWSYGNGHSRWGDDSWAGNGAGFSFGGGDPTPRGAHRVRQNAAWGNLGHGFAAEANTGGLALTDNTAFDNGASGFDLTDANGTARGNLAVDNGVRRGADVSSRGNSWDGAERSRTTFRSTDPAVAEGPRRPDGTLPATTYLVSRDGLGADMTPP